MLIPFTNPAFTASDSCKPKLSPDTPPSVVLYLQKWERPCCCFCSSNEMPSDLFMNYLFGTAPLCSVHFFYPLWSHVAQWLLMQLFVIQSLPSPPVSLWGGLYLSWHVPGCVGGGSDSLSRCEHPILLHAKQWALQLISSCREESWWQYSKHITINPYTGPGPSHKDNELLFLH